MHIMFKRTLLLLLSLLLLFTATSAAEPLSTVRIALLKDADEINFTRMVSDEIQTLLKHRHPHKITTLNIPSEPDQILTQIDALMQDPAVDIILSLSFRASAVLGQHTDYPKPTIAAAIINRGIQGFPITSQQTSGQPNFTYIDSPFDIGKDLQTFKTIFDFKQLGVLLPLNSMTLYADFFTFIGRRLLEIDSQAKFTLIESDPSNVPAILDSIPPEVDAIYLTPIFLRSDPENEKRFLNGLIAKKLPSFALGGEASVRLGAMASIAPDTQFMQVSRRIALNVMKIIEGANAADLQVVLDTYHDNFVLNEATLRALDIYPNWEILDQARFINREAALEGPQANLRTIITQALERNLTLQLARQDTRIQMDQVDIARSGLYPQLSASTSLTTLDRNRATGDPGAPAPSSWLLSGQLSQLIYADDVWTNYAIQKILAQAALYEETGQMLDTILDTAQGYIALLQAKSSHRILENNLDVTRQNLSIARKKQTVGYTGATDVYRWESELAQNKIALNDAFRDTRQAQLQLNRLINRPLTDPLNIEEVTPNRSVPLLVTDEKILRLINNYRDTMVLADFLVAEAGRYSPELLAIDATISAQQRTVLNKRRAGYLPDIQLNAQIDKTLDEYDTDYTTPSDLDHPWSVSAVASFPLFDGKQRKHEKAQAEHQLTRYQIQKKDLTGQLNLAVRANLETATVSYRKVELSQNAYEAAKKNFDLIQNAYQEGTASVITLVDAQNGLVSAQQNVAIAAYQFVLDFLSLERSTGAFHFLRTPEEKAAFYQRLYAAFASTPTE